MTTEHERLSLVERDLRDHAKSISEIATAQIDTKRLLSDLERKEIERTVEDRHLDERLDRIESSLRAIYGLGKWVLGAIGSVLIVAVVTFALKGGPLG